MRYSKTFARRVFLLAVIESILNLLYIARHTQETSVLFVVLGLSLAVTTIMYLLDPTRAKIKLLGALAALDFAFTLGWWVMTANWLARLSWPFTSSLHFYSTVLAAVVLSIIIAGRVVVFETKAAQARQH